MNALPTNSLPLPTVPRPAVRFHIYFLTYGRAVHTLMALFSVHRRRTFRLFDVALGPLTCDYAVRLHLYSSHVLVPM